MNNDLNKRKLKYDSPRYSEMYVFLNHILTIAKSNPNMYLSDSIVYNELKKFTLTGKDLNEFGQPKSVEHLFNIWINDFKSVRNISVFNSPDWKYWCQFTNNGYADEYIKIYVPLDGDGLYDCAKDIFNFMAKHNMSHQSKVGKELRNDNVVIRLHKGDEKSLRLLIDYINSNPRIQAHLNKPNPFLPSIDGIGVMNETGISYNDELCKTITRFVNRNRNADRLRVEDFLEYMKRYTYKREVFSAFKHATSSEEQYFDANEIVYGNISRKEKESSNQQGNQNEQENQVLTDLQKHTLLNDTIKVTFDKYGMNQVTTALLHAINRGYYDYFSNGKGKYREYLKSNVSPQEIKNILLKTMSNITNKKYNDISELVSDYCSLFFRDQTVSKLDDMCEVTLKNYNAASVSSALNRYIYYGETIGFSRFKKDKPDGINYREYCRFFDSRSMLIALRKSLQLKGIDTSLIKDEQLTSYYAEVLSSSDYKMALESQDYGSFSR